MPALANSSADMRDKGEIRLRVGRKLRQLRLLRDFSQWELAGRSGIGHKHIGAVERGQVNASIDVLAKLASALDVDVIELFEPSPSDANAPAIYTLTQRELDHVQRALGMLDRAKRRRVPRQARKRR